MKISSVEVFMVDIDYKPEDIEDFAREFASKIVFAFRLFNIDYVSTEVYETNKGYHVYVYANPKIELDNKDVIIIQLILGSDYKREAFNLYRVMSGEYGQKDRSWNVLFHRKFSKGVEVSSEKSTEQSELMTEIINELCSEKLL